MIPLQRKRRKWSDPLASDAYESEITAAIRSHVNRLPWARLWRNNTGELEDKRGRWVSYGLGIGSPDLVGIVRRKGGIGVFVGIEVKRGARKPSVNQVEWLKMIDAFGGVSASVNSVDEALEIIAIARVCTIHEVKAILSLPPNSHIALEE